jgi:hypothetical protein
VRHSLHRGAGLTIQQAAETLVSSSSSDIIKAVHTAQVSIFGSSGVAAVQSALSIAGLDAVSTDQAHLLLTATPRRIAAWILHESHGKEIEGPQHLACAVPKGMLSTVGCGART